MAAIPKNSHKQLTIFTEHIFIAKKNFLLGEGGKQQFCNTLTAK